MKESIAVVVASFLVIAACAVLGRHLGVAGRVSARRHGWDAYTATAPSAITHNSALSGMIIPGLAIVDASGVAPIAGASYARSAGICERLFRRKAP